ncbi:MAG TPA: AzlD domain-containing protein [Micromonosporaceae bacterium]|jgi:branched-subunit amino acid transport protein
MREWLIVLIAGLGSYALRMSMVMTGRLTLPPRLEASADLVAPAAFAALTASSLAESVVSTPSPAAAAPIVLAIFAAVLATAWSGRPYAAMLAGMPTYWLAAALFSL